MEYFESIIKTLLETSRLLGKAVFQGQSYKTGKEANWKGIRLPRPEIDILAFKPKAQEVLALEAKSYFDSPGVRLADLQEECEIPEGRYKLFTCTNYRDIVFNRLSQDLRELGMVGGDLKITLGLVAGNIYQGLSARNSFLRRIERVVLLVAGRRSR